MRNTINDYLQNTSILVPTISEIPVSNIKVLFASDDFLIVPNPDEVSLLLSQNATFPNFLNQRCCLLTKSYNYDVAIIALL